MKYPVAIHKDQDSCCGVTVPDVPGCYSAGETLDEAIKNAQEAISSHLELLAEEGDVAINASVVDDHVGSKEFEGAIWAYVDVDVTAFLGKTEKVTITLPKLLIKKIDALVAEGGAKSRFAFLAESALKSLR
ncbi:MAG: type II toxin-antitoxin system HicB family antitoxin [Desulforhopalus sp.]